MACSVKGWPGLFPHHWAAAQVAAVYQQCGYEADGGLSTVQMLANMEARLEELSLGVEDLPYEAVITCQRLREKERCQVGPALACLLLVCP